MEAPSDEFELIALKILEFLEFLGYFGVRFILLERAARVRLRSVPEEKSVIFELDQCLSESELLQLQSFTENMFVDELVRENGLLFCL